MNQNDLISHTGLADQARMLAEQRGGSLTLIESTLNAIAAAQPSLNAFRCVRADAARAEAAEADRRLAAGERLPLLGVPVAIKDDTDIAGESTPFGCAGRFPTATRDAEVVRRLRAAGAVIIGKTTTPEIGQWPVTAGPAFGVTRNPWNLERTPGGSSGGAAAAVAAGIVAGAVGSDGAGSIRIPAAWTNLVGIKPQLGRVSTWPQPELFNGLTVIGPLARTVGDAALLLDALSGNRPGDRHRPPAPPEPFAAAAEREPTRLRIALSTRIPFSGLPARLDPGIRRCVERLGEVLSGLGHDVEETDPAYGPIGAAFIPKSLAGVHVWARRVPEFSDLDPRTRQNAAIGRLLDGPLLRAARAAEPLLRRRVGSIFRRYDVVLTPTTARPAPAADALDGLSPLATDRLMVGACPYAWPWNVLGWPAVNVPAGFAPDDGTPLGAQLLGPAASEPLLISLAAELEAVERWHERRPDAVVVGETAAVAT